MSTSLRGLLLLALGACAPDAPPPEPVGTTAGLRTLCQVAPQPAGAPDSALALIEIPRGGRAKYEFDATTGRLVVSRMLPPSHPYPAAYGTFPCTMAGDGDPLDLLLLSDVEVVPGALVPVRPIGLLRMRDRGAQDDKLLVVALGDTRDSSTMAERTVIETFFRSYKGPGADLEVGPWYAADSARAQLRAAVAAAARR